MQEPLHIAIVGAGLVGTLLAIQLKRIGHKISVFERSEDIRLVEFKGKSINLAVSNRGWKTLDDLNIGNQVRHIAIAMDKRAIHKVNQTIDYQKYGIHNESIYSVSRGGLNKLLIDIAEKEGIQFFFEHKIEDVSLSDAVLKIKNNKGEQHEQIFDKIFGADGAYSKIRSKMQRQNRFNYSQFYLSVGYKELHIASNNDAGHKLDKNSFHIWPHGDFMLIALPNQDGSFTCTLFLPFEGTNSFKSINTKEKLHSFFLKYFPDAFKLIENLEEDFFNNPTSSLVTTQCYPWTYQDKIALIGDAAHAIVPFYGQGMNAGFEDITELAHQIESHANNWHLAFKNYQEIRKPNTDAIAELSFRNFNEMSSKTTEKQFLLQKKIEKNFTAAHPDKWLPLYDRVTFSLRPYAEALAIGDKQKAIMDKVLQLPNIEEIWNSEKVNEFIINELKK